MAFFFSNSKGVADLERLSMESTPRHHSSRSSFGSPYVNRSLSIRSGKSTPGPPSSTHGRKGFSFASLRGSTQPELSKRLYRLIKSTNNLVSSHEAAGKERDTIARELSEWGEQTQDDGVSDVSDKVGVILSELGVQEENYAHGIDEARGVLKTIRNTEKSVQPSRDNKGKIADEIQKLKIKEPQSTRLVVLEQELVRAEAENLVAEAQLTNVTRKKLKEAYDAEFLSVIERAEKQIILAKHGRRLLDLLDDTPVTPGDSRRAYEHGGTARQVLNDAEDDLKAWDKNRDDDHRAWGKGRDDSVRSANDGSRYDDGGRPVNDRVRSVNDGGRPVSSDYGETDQIVGKAHIGNHCAEGGEPGEAPTMAGALGYSANSGAQADDENVNPTIAAAREMENVELVK
ncbi:Uu.00g040700.m01.CDS01 [Anthostomella pinea]|uniref:Uu.00g040700.m01.CDS01 n=1 Tax=Anthostomella pinea TaxID=933095 RepID=A0AAI8VAR9_9PEZI|nr:Uu.00g040700.m01.CDS01 [Anthostomella pinea]